MPLNFKIPSMNGLQSWPNCFCWTKSGACIRELTIANTWLRPRSCLAANGSISIVSTTSRAKCPIGSPMYRDPRSSRQVCCGLATWSTRGGGAIYQPSFIATSTRWCVVWRLWHARGMPARRPSRLATIPAPERKDSRPLCFESGNSQRKRYKEDLRRCV